MIVKIHTKVKLSAIVGVSPHNPRQQVDDSDLDALADSLFETGPIDEILVDRCDNCVAAPGYSAGPGLYCLDGSRRWRAYLKLVADGRAASDIEIEVVEVVGSAADKAEVAFAANFHRLKLHPVEEFEAFEKMSIAGRSDHEIAKAFRLELADVKKSLALGRMAPEIRAAWKAAEIGDAVARVFAGERDRTKQLDVFTQLSAEKRKDADLVRRMLRGDAIVASHSIAVFVRADYLAAGGEIVESLFEPDSLFVDGRLARDLAAKKLGAIAERTKRAQGWKFGLTEFDGALADSAAFISIGKPDYSDDDKARQDEIDALDLGSLSPAERGKLAKEAEEIELRAWSRGVSTEERAKLGFVLSIDLEGGVIMDGGLMRAEDRPPPAAVEDAPRKAARKEPMPPASAPAPIVQIDDKRQVRALKDAIMVRAIGDCATRNVNLALAIAVATLATQGLSISSIRATIVPGRPNDLLDEIKERTFAEALARCAAAPLADLIAAFANLVGRSIALAGFDSDRLGGIVQTIGETSAIGASLDRAFDRKAYFDAVPKDQALRAIHDCQGATAATEAASLPRDKIADQAARVASDKAWFPQPWSTWLAEIGDAAGAAPGYVAQDKADAGGEISDADARTKSIERFLETRTRRQGGQSIMAGDLHAAFLAWCIGEKIDQPAALGQFGQICKALGLKRHRTAAGKFYLDLALRDVAPAQTAAE